MIVVLNSFKFTGKQGNIVYGINVLNKIPAADTYFGEVDVKSESYFLSEQKFGSLRFSPGEIIEVDWERNYKGQAIPKAVRSTGQFEPNIVEFMSF